MIFKMTCTTPSEHHTVAQSVACPLCMQDVSRSSLDGPSRFMKKIFPCPLIGEEQDVSYWQQNVH